MTFLNYKITLPTIIIILLCSTAFTQNSTYQREYLLLKERGKYDEAIKLLKRWSLKLTDPVLLETNIFRINEILKYPELYDEGLDAFDNIRKNITVKNNAFLCARIDHFKNHLLLKKGMIGRAKSNKHNLGFLDFHMVGPHSNNSISEFEKTYPPERRFENREYPGKVHNISWFKAKADHRGIINPGEFHSKINNTFYYLYNGFQIKKNSAIYIILGKTGFTDIWLDGKRIFNNRKRHNFLHDQYFIKVFLKKGNHIILIKTGDSENGIKISMRLTDSRGKGLKLSKTRSSLKNNKTKNNIVFKDKNNSPVILNTSMFPSLQSLLNLKISHKHQSFITGYMLYQSKTCTESNTPVMNHLSKIDRSDFLYSSASYYLGKSEKVTEKKEEYFKKSLKSHGKNIESLNEMINIRIENKFFFEAFALIEQIQNVHNNHEFSYRAKAKLFHHMGWELAALKAIKILKKLKYPSMGHKINAWVNIADKKYSIAIKDLQFLRDRDQFNKPYLIGLFKCYKKTGQYKKAKRLLYNALAMFPNDVFIKLRLAGIIEIKSGARAALPLISSVLINSPQNKKALMRLGILYHKLKKTSLARYYLKLALYYDPDNYPLKRYLNILEYEENEIGNYLFKKDITQLKRDGDKYNNEPALILLDETAFRVNSDGSFEKWKHKIIQINDKTASTDFKNHFIVINPKLERMENLKCYVINDNAKIEIQNKYRRSLSDPESRLYYDLEAIIMPIASIKKGSIIDISYRIKNSGAVEFKNYFGEKLTIGGKYRTLNSNIVLSYPDNKKIYTHTIRINDKKNPLSRNRGKNIYRLSIKNSPPYKKEDAMPHQSEFLPLVYFTSHKNWDELYSWYKSLLRNKITLTNEIKEALNKIISKKDKPIDRVRKIYNHVTKEIRYVGFELGVGGIQPRSAGMTYNSKMGDCKDISILLIAMLREAGISSKLALLRTRDKGGANLSIPFLGEFNHAICYVNLKKKFFIDGTSKNTGFMELPSDNRNVESFIVGEKNYKFINTDSILYKKDYDGVTNKVKILISGDAILIRKLEKNGSSASQARYSLKYPKKKNRSLTEYWNNNFPGSTVDGLKIKSTSLSGTAVYEYKVKIPSFAQVGDGEMIFKPFLIPTDYYKNYAMSSKRVFPISTNHTKITVSNKYFIPRGYKVYYLPDNIKFVHKKFSVKFTYSLKDDIITVTSMIEVKAYRILKKEYMEFKIFARLINKKEMENIILIKK
ncbi:DUF3857 domain-containing protein [Spirochaetota bacterium]